METPNIDAVLECTSLEEYGIPFATLDAARNEMAKVRETLQQMRAEHKKITEAILHNFDLGTTYVDNHQALSNLMQRMHTAENLLRSPGIRAFAQERLRQISEEGWSAEHDDEQMEGGLALAGAMYAINSTKKIYPWSPSDLSTFWFHLWHWAQEWWKPSTRKRDLEKAGALLAAEYDRLSRAEGK